jgi:anti-anti-sigma factor
MDDLGANGAEAKVQTGRDPSGARVVTIAGELDISNVDKIERNWQSALDGTRDHIVFDLAELTFMDSAGLAMLLRAQDRGIDVTVRNPSTIVRRIIEVTGLSERLLAGP